MAQRKFIIDGGFKTDDASELLANLTMGGTIDMDSNRILNVGTPSASTDATSKSYVDTAVAGVVDAAPGTLDTLNELAAALGDDANFSATITSSLATKATTTYVDAQISATETYADTAETDAIAAAAIDATTKADSAQADAQSYTDAREVLINNAWADADTTQTTALEAYADAAEADAISTAAGDATSKANAAQAAAEATEQAAQEAAQQAADEAAAVAQELAHQQQQAQDAAQALAHVIYFDFDQSTIKAEFRTALNGHAAYLSQNPSAKIVLEGHADERGTREYNIALGERRGNAVSRYLVVQGVSVDAIEVVSFGEERPVNSGHDSASWAENRRVEIRYINY